MLFSATCIGARRPLDKNRREESKSFTSIAQFSHFPNLSLPEVSFCDPDRGSKWFTKSKLAIVAGGTDDIYIRARAYLDQEDPSESEISEGIKYLEQAADHGHAQAQIELGDIYHNSGLKSEAVQYYKLAADQGNSQGQYSLGLCYDHGFGVPQDHDEATRYLKLAADQGDSLALYTLAMKQFPPEGADMQGPEAKLFLDYMIRAADQGLKEAQNYVGVLYVEGVAVPKDYNRAAEYYRRAAEQGHAIAQHNLADLYLQGIGVPKDLQKAEQLFKLSADRGYIRAQYMLANSYYHGVFEVAPALLCSLALHYFKLAADQGHRFSAYRTGFLHIHLQKNEADEALRYLRFASQNGELAAETMIGHCLIYGYGVEQDVHKGLRLMRECAEKGCTVAYQQLAELYATGAPGVPQSPEMAQNYSDMLAEQLRLGTNLVDARAPNFWKLYKW